MHFSGHQNCTCILCLEFNGGEKYSSVSCDGEEKIIVVEQPKKDRRLPFTYFGMEVDSSGQETSINYFKEEEDSSNAINNVEICNTNPEKHAKETQLVSVELQTEELDEDFVIEFLENNILNIIYKNTFSYANHLIQVVQQEYYSEDDPPVYFFEDEDNRFLDR